MKVNMYKNIDIVNRTTGKLKIVVGLTECVINIDKDIDMILQKVQETLTDEKLSKYIGDLVYGLKNENTAEHARGTLRKYLVQDLIATIKEITDTLKDINNKEVVDTLKDNLKDYDFTGTDFKTLEDYLGSRATREYLLISMREELEKVIGDKEFISRFLLVNEEVSTPELFLSIVRKYVMNLPVSIDYVDVEKRLGISKFIDAFKDKPLVSTESDDDNKVEPIKESTEESQQTPDVEDVPKNLVRNFILTLSMVEKYMVDIQTYIDDYQTINTDEVVEFVEVLSKRLPFMEDMSDIGTSFVPHMNNYINGIKLVLSLLSSVLKNDVSSNSDINVAIVNVSLIRQKLKEVASKVRL